MAVSKKISLFIPFPFLQFENDLGKDLEIVFGLGLDVGKNWKVFDRAE